MTVLGIQYLCGGFLAVRSNGQTYEIEADTDTYADGVEIDLRRAEYEETATGFRFRVNFGDKGGQYCDLGRIKRTVKQFAALNPQVTFRLVVDDEKTLYRATDDPTVETLSLATSGTTGKATWFTYDGFKNRLKADVQAAPDLPLRDFVREFCKLSSKHRDVLSRLPPSVAKGTIQDLFDKNDHMRSELVRDLFDSMRSETSTYSPSGIDRSLGCVGKDLKEQLIEHEGNQELVTQLRENDDEGIDLADLALYKSGGDVIEVGEKVVPFNFELAAIPTEAVRGKQGRCNLTFGVNQSVTYSEPSFEIVEQLEVKHFQKETPNSYFRVSSAFQKVGHNTAVVCNLTCPNIDFKDKGKQDFDLTPFRSVMGDIVGKAVRNIERHHRAKLNDLVKVESKPKPDPELDNKAHKGFIKDFIYEEFDNAYDDVSDGGVHLVLMRQFFYEMRPRFEDEKKRRGYQWTWKSKPGNKKKLALKYGTFSEAVSEYEEEELGERIVHRDKRGFFSNPHKSGQVELSTQGVKRHSPDITKFGAVLFVEKTGYYEVLSSDFELDKRFDIGLIQAKGYSNKALRSLVEEIQTEGDIPMLTLTDLDIAGMGIAADAKKADDLSAVDMFDTKRIGVTLEDVSEHDLPIEPADYKDKVITEIENKHDAGEVSDEVYEFLTADGGQRIEINAFRPAELEDYLETKFEELGIEKVHPAVEDVETPETNDIGQIRENVRNEAVGDYVLNECKEELLGETESTMIDGDDRETDIGMTLEDVPTGDNAQEEMHEDICNELADHPPEHWTEINHSMKSDYQREIHEETNKHKEEKREAWADYLSENFEIRVISRDNGE